MFFAGRYIAGDPQKLTSGAPVFRVVERQEHILFDPRKSVFIRGKIWLCDVPNGPIFSASPRVSVVKGCYPFPRAL